MCCATCVEHHVALAMRADVARGSLESPNAYAEWCCDMGVGRWVASNCVSARSNTCLRAANHVERTAGEEPVSISPAPPSSPRCDRCPPVRPGLSGILISPPDIAAADKRLDFVEAKRMRARTGSTTSRNRFRFRILRTTARWGCLTKRPMVCGSYTA